MRLDIERLDRALARALVGVTSADEAYAAVCSSLRSEVGEALLTSVYVEDEDRLWLSAQRGYHQVVHTHSLGAGLFARAYDGNQSIAVERSVSSDPRYVLQPDDSNAQSHCARFNADVTGVVGIESRERLAERDGRAIVESAARAIEHALERLSARGHLRGSGRLRLLRAVSAIAACHEPLAIVELLARSVGGALGLDDGRRPAVGQPQSGGRRHGRPADRSRPDHAKSRRKMSV